LKAAFTAADSTLWTGVTKIRQIILLLWLLTAIAIILEFFCNKECVGRKSRTLCDGEF
jgi:hypothetical protein